MTRGAAALAAALLLACAPEPPPPPLPRPTPPPAAITGTFSDHRYVEEAGDLVGTEIAIDVGPDGEYRAHVTFAVGMPEPTITVPVTYDATGDCHRVTLHVGAPYDTHFTGCIGVVALVGTLRYPNGTEERVYLMRQP